MQLCSYLHVLSCLSRLTSLQAVLNLVSTLFVLLLPSLSSFSVEIYYVINLIFNKDGELPLYCMCCV